MWVCVAVGDSKLGKSYFIMKDTTMQCATKGFFVPAIGGEEDEQGRLEPACTGRQKPMLGISSQWLFGEITVTA